MKNSHLRGLLEAMLGDPEISRRYKTAPAAKQIHHAYLGGLIEHVLSLCKLAALTASHYRMIDQDLLLTGVVLHDIGKIYELSYERGFSYTTEGQLLGHISIAMRMVSDKLARMPDFPPRLRMLVEHMILSHHGRLEFGSPKVPQFPEAMLLHYLDDLDSKMECMRVMVDRDRLVEGYFTGYSSSMERSILKKAKFLDERAPALTEAPHPTAPPPSAPLPSTPTAPSMQQRPAPPKPVAAPPRPSSVFGDKLIHALAPDSGKGS
jgi:3'-5' exoribonuclease